MQLPTGFCILWLVWLVRGESCEPKVVCYFQGWAVERIGYANFEISDIDLTLCTHVIYGVGLSTENGGIKLRSPGSDLPDNGGKAGFRKLNALRKQNEKLKTLLSVENDVTLFLKVGTDTSLRSRYIKNLVEFVLRHEFDGLDIYWKALGISYDGLPNYVILMEELRAKLDEHNLLLSINVAGPEVQARWYLDIYGISKHVDFISLDIECHNAKAPTTGHVAPLYPGVRTTSSVELTLNTNASVHYWLSQGVPAEKLILGIRFWGTRYILKNPAEHQPGSPTILPTANSTSSKPIGYNEICRLISQDTWTSVWDEERHAPYSYGGNQWITYDNVRSAIEKGKYAKALGLGGVMGWSIDADDHRGDCGTRNPILNAMNCGIRNIGCNPDPTPKTRTLARVPDHAMSGSASVDAKIVCYYRSMAAGTIGYESMTPSEIDPTLCTHLMYASVGVTEDHDVAHLSPETDLPDNGGLAGFQKVNELRKQNEKLKTLLVTRSWVEDSARYSKVVANSSTRAKYVKNVVDFVLRYEFDGFQINWYSSAANGRRLEYSQNYLLLLKELRTSFDEHELILSILIDGFEVGSRSYSNIPEISKYVDFISLFCVYRLGSEPTTGHLEPLYPSSSETSSYDLTRNVNASVNYWLNRGAPAEKLILSAWFFGISYALDNPAENSRGSPGRVSNAPNNNSPSISYNQICRLPLQDDAWSSVWDEEQRVPYIYAGNRWISYEDVRSLTEKAEYVKAMGLGGMLANHIDQDDHRGECGERFPLMKALHCALREVNCTVSIPKYSSPTKPASGGTFPSNPIADRIAGEQARRTCARLGIKYVRHSQNCARFWICQKSQEDQFRAEPFSCAAGLYFDTSKVACRNKTLVQCS